MGRLRPPLDAPARLYERRVADLIAFRADEVAAEPPGRDATRARRAEADRLRARLPPGAYRVAVDPAGRVPRSSDAFATWLTERVESARPLAFLLGGTSGLADDLRDEAEERLSLGPLTMPHQLARVVLAEQLYRALCIRAGHPYPR